MKLFEIKKVPFVELKPMHLAALIPMAVALNFVGSAIARTLKLPIYLDQTGNILVALVGGFWPGIVTGILTSVVNGLLLSPTSLPFVIGNVGGVIILATCARWGITRTWPGFIITLFLDIIWLSLASSTIATYMFGGLTGSGVDIATAAMLKTFNSVITGTFFAHLGMSIVDKTILFFVVLAILRALPPHWRETTPIHD